MEYKRRTSARNSKSKGSGRIFTAVVIILSIILIAGILVFSPAGDYLLAHVLAPVFSCSKEKKENQSIVSALEQQDQTIANLPSSPKPSEKAHQVITIDETPYYILQMGAFLEQNAAETHAEEIRRLGAGGTVYADGSVYRVFAAAYTDEESLTKVQAQVRSDGFEATPYITEKKAIKLTLEGDVQAVRNIEEAVQLMNRLPNELCYISLSFDKGETDEAEMTAALQKLSADCKQCLEIIDTKTQNPISPICELLKKYHEKLSTFLYGHDTMNTEMLSGELKNLQLSILIDYILFFEQK